VKAIHIFQTNDEAVVRDQITLFLKKQLAEGKKPDLLLSGENGDSRFLKFYTLCESVVGHDVPVARFKHLMGEYPAVSCMALWLACEFIKKNRVPEHLLKKKIAGLPELNDVFIYNNFKGLQHSVMLVGAAG
jgi:hypothetical protein